MPKNSTGMASNTSLEGSEEFKSEKPYKGESHPPHEPIMLESEHAQTIQGAKWSNG